MIVYYHSCFNSFLIVNNPLEKTTHQVQSDGRVLTPIRDSNMFSVGVGLLQSEILPQVMEFKYLGLVHE